MEKGLQRLLNAQGASFVLIPKSQNVQHLIQGESADTVGTPSKQRTYAFHLRSRSMWLVCLGISRLGG
jgi:hypothetical protein